MNERKKRTGKVKSKAFRFEYLFVRGTFTAKTSPGANAAELLVHSANPLFSCWFVPLWAIWIFGLTEMGNMADGQMWGATRWGSRRKKTAVGS